MKKLLALFTIIMIAVSAVSAGAENAATDLFALLDGQRFEFCSGVGAWGTELAIGENGAFKGSFHDSEMGETGEGYPDGSIYGCSFHGQLSDPEPVDEFTWTAKISAEQDEGQVPEAIEDGIRYVTAAPYGLEKARTVTIYLPGTPVDQLPEGFLIWSHLQEIDPDAKAIPYYAIWNEADEAGFVSDIFPMNAPADDEIGYYPDDYPESRPYVNTWVAENGDWRIEVYGEDGGIKPMVVHRLGDNKEDIWEYATALNPDKTALTAVPFGLHYRQDTVTYDWDETYYEDGDAVFTLNENGQLLWNDLKENAGKGLVFDKIGNFYGGRWMKGNTEVIFHDWYEGEYDIRCFQYGENDAILADAILKGVYDPETDTITAEGFFDPDAPFTVVFSYDEQNNVVWTENGESTVLEYSYRTD